ncbi:Metallo-dependent phosphatase [Amniculicola lignicola CBS 123094]|uniref:Metallo-dependent phosphatase n=1 Tax=Amniculicola lignicola CBS 123094 TaxID=1392246 RepID=A0A6A5VVP5_9PLEO|nr:Metallo-dependent phosphatase [Amniculicola lignicola CBS 123094]
MAQEQKDLYLYTSQQSAWLYVALAKEEELGAEDLLVVDIKVGELAPNPSSGHSWETVTEVDVLFSTDAVDPRPQWALMRLLLQIYSHLEVPVPRLSVLYGRAKPKVQPALRIRQDGTFKIVQISDTHMVTGVRVCKDAIDAYRENLPESKADPLTVDFIGKTLDVKKPDLVVVAPIIECLIPFAAVFGNHDSEGIHVLSRMAQMSILQNLPFSLSPAPSQLPLLTLYFLDLYGQISSKIYNPDYDYIKQSQIDCARKKEDNNNPFYLSLAFLHIPLPEFSNCDLSIRKGYKREPPEGPYFNSHFYDALAREGILALGCGHDHVNDFSFHPVPWLCYAGGSGFGGYCLYGRERIHRRMRVWELDMSTESLKTWKQVEYAADRVDELVLVERGMVVEPPAEPVKGCVVV